METALSQNATGKGYTFPCFLVVLHLLSRSNRLFSSPVSAGILLQEVEGREMPREVLDKLSIYIPKKHQAARVMERLIKLGDKRDRSINYLVVDAILEYLEREEKRRELARRKQRSWERR